MLRIGAVLVLGVLLWLPAKGLALNEGSNQMSGVIAGTAESPRPRLLDGAVPVTITLTNRASEPVSVLLPYPNPNNLSFSCAQLDFAEPKPVEPDEIERAAPTVIPPQGSFRVTYYLNRYFKFAKPGGAKFTYELRTLVTGGGSTRSEVFTGVFDVNLIPASKEQLRNEFAQYARGLSSSDRTARMEAAEALAFVDVPDVVPYLLPMLQIDNLEVIAIHALARHPSPASAQGITSMLARPSSSVVGAALEEIDRLKIPMRREQVQKLLQSDNPGTQWLALEWLADRPSREDLPFLSPVIATGSEAVKERARAYEQSLNAK